MQRKRRIELSALNVFFCITVIFIHVISYAVSYFQPNSLKYTAVMIPWRLASFVVQGFIMLAGIKLFLNKKDEQPFGKYIKGRLKGIIIPYAVAFAVYYIYFIIVHDYPIDAWFIIKQFFLGSLVYHLYFIPIIFQFDLLQPLWKRVINSCSPVIIIPFSIFITIILGNCLPQMITTVFPNCNFIYNDRVFTTYLVYWVAGCYIGKNYDAFCDMIKSNFRVLCVTFGVSLVFMVWFCYLSYNGLAYVPYLNYIINFYVLFVCIFVFAVALKIPAAVYEKIPLMARVDKFSLYIYLYHVMLLMIAEKIIRVII